ncbi:MAG: acyltransferase family protein [Bacteroidales bacterium]|nr:acyltransferase family protein [Bacteroidales bacterium]
METGKRIGWIDIGKCIGIFLVVFCHCGLKTAFTQWVYSFHMPFFFFVSGMVYVQRGEFKDFFYRRFRQIMVPYILFSLILCFGSQSYKDWVNLLIANRESLNSSSSFTPLWFLPCLFLSSVLMDIHSRLLGRCKLLLKGVTAGLVVIIGFVISSRNTNQLPWSLDIALVGFGFMWAGNHIRKLFDSSSKKSGILYVIVICGLAVAGTILAFYNLPQSLTPGCPHVEMSIGHYGKPLLFLFSALSLSLFIVLLSQFLGKVLDRLKLIWLRSRIVETGQFSLGIMCIHGVVIVFLHSVLNHLGDRITDLVIFCEAILVLIISYMVIYISIKFVPNLFGKFQEQTYE